MEQLSIKPIELTKDNLIYPYPAKGAEDVIIYLRNPGFKHIEYYVNISGGLVVMGLDEKKVLKDIEVSFMRSKWKEENDLKIPTNYAAAGLLFTNIFMRSNELDLPILARTNQTRSIVFFTWGEEQSVSSYRWYALSRQCFALVAESRFKGLLVEISKDT